MQRLLSDHDVQGHVSRLMDICQQTCQDHNILLITGNRNAESPESLEMTIRQRNASNCLPVLTLANPDRIQRDRPYAKSIRWVPSPSHASRRRLAGAR